MDNAGVCWSDTEAAFLWDRLPDADLVARRVLKDIVSVLREKGGYGYLDALHMAEAVLDATPAKGDAMKPGTGT